MMRNEEKYVPSGDGSHVRSNKSTALLIRNLPPSLSEQQIRDLLVLFRATSIRYMGDVGKWKYCAIATFDTTEYATQALKQLHQLSVMNFVLRVEYVNSQHLLDKQGQGKQLLSTSDQSTMACKDNHSSLKTNVQSPSLPLKQGVTASKINSLSKYWDLHYHIDENLCYQYPGPTESTLQNIVHCMVSVPKLYTQVLHLMNKMHLPPPFGELTTRPPLLEDSALHMQQQVSSSEESEMESSDDNSKTKRAGTDNYYMNE